MAGNSFDLKEGSSTPLNIWPLLGASASNSPRPDPDRFRASVQKLAELISPVLAEYLLSGAIGRPIQPLLDPALLQVDRLNKRFTFAQHRRWAQAIVAARIDVVFMKGFANAHVLYPDPAVRIQGDLDILVRSVDLDRLIDFLLDQGFHCPEADNNPWGMISDCSFLPFVSADGVSHIDIHIHPDSYPAHRSLTTELVIAKAQQLDRDGMSIRVPSIDHSFLLCVTNAAKDKFNISSVGKIIDGILLLKLSDRLDWDSITRLAKDGRFHLPLRAFLALLNGLGITLEGVPPGLYTPLHGLRGTALRQVIQDFRAYFPQELPMTALLWRELTLCAEPDIALHNAALRWKGLFRPRAGFPDRVLANKRISLTNCSNPGT